LAAKYNTVVISYKTTRNVASRRRAGEQAQRSVQTSPPILPPYHQFFSRHITNFDTKISHCLKAGANNRCLDVQHFMSIMATSVVKVGTPLTTSLLLGD
jgi:hypothetical protein